MLPCDDKLCGYPAAVVDKADEVHAGRPFRHADAEAAGGVCGGEQERPAVHVGDPAGGVCGA